MLRKRPIAIRRLAMFIILLPTVAASAYEFQPDQALADAVLIPAKDAGRWLAAQLV
jgi:hypothetical protein